MDAETTLYKRMLEYFKNELSIGNNILIRTEDGIDLGSKFAKAV
jgi:hypothetical protein